jgi:hypothetical protein
MFSIKRLLLKSKTEIVEMKRINARVLTIVMRQINVTQIHLYASFSGKPDFLNIVQFHLSLGIF